MYRNRKKYIKPAGWILFLLCFYAAASFTGCDPALFVSRSSHLSDLAADMLRPDLSYFPKILLPLFYTVQMSVTGTVTGSALALIVSPFGAVSLHFPSWAMRFLRLLIQVLRSFPALIPSPASISFRQRSRFCRTKSAFPRRNASISHCAVSLLAETKTRPSLWTRRFILLIFFRCSS